MTFLYFWNQTDKQTHRALQSQYTIYCNMFDIYLTWICDSSLSNSNDLGPGIESDLREGPAGSPGTSEEADLAVK